jgi:hypothetical protein
MSDAVLRAVLGQMVRSWGRQAADTRLMNSERAAYRSCAQELGAALAGARPPVPDLSMEVRVYGADVEAMTQRALSAGRQAFPGHDVALVSLHVRESFGAAERTRAETVGGVLITGWARIRAVPADGEPQRGPAAGDEVSSGAGRLHRDGSR